MYVTIVVYDDINGWRSQNHNSKGVSKRYTCTRLDEGYKWGRSSWKVDEKWF